MIGASHYDVCVVGGGPAGAALATLLACSGRSVLLAESDAPGPDRPGEYLAADVLPALERLGVALPALESPGTVSCWTPGPPVIVSALLDLIFWDSQLNVYAGQLEVRPPGAPTTG